MPKIGKIRGRVWKFGDNISTTDIAPGEMFMGVPHEAKDIVFAAIKPDWKDKVKPGDCIVAEENFGFGSHRESANEGFIQLGIGFIVADSIARVYYRNAIALGQITYPCKGVSTIFDEGDEIELDVNKGEVRNLTSGKSIKGKPYSPELMEILGAGGLTKLLVQKAREMK